MYKAQTNPYAQNVEIVKGYFKRVPVLILAILQFLSTVLTITASLFFTSWSVLFLQEMLSQFGETSSSMGLPNIDELVRSSVISTYASVIPSAIVGVLITVGYLILFFKSRSKNPGSNPRAGATILFVLSLIEMILSIIGAVMIVIAFIVMSVALGIAASNPSSYNSFNAGPAVLIAGITTAVVLFLMLFYSINKMRYFKSVKNSCSSTNLYNEGAGAYGVMNIVFAVFALLCCGVSALMIPLANAANGLTPSVVDFSAFYSLDISSLLTLVIFGSAVLFISVVYMILEAVVALGYKNYINKIKYDYKPAEVPDAPYQPEISQRYAAPLNYPQQAESVSQSKPQESASSPAGPTYCTACGAPLDPASEFCTNCGKKLK